LAGTALAVNCGSGDTLRESGGQGGVTSDIGALFAHLGHTTPIHVVDQVGFNPSTVYDLVQNFRADINRVNSTQDALPWFSDPHRGANCFNNYSISHGVSIPYPE
jgi:hypothetical protein